MIRGTTIAAVLVLFAGMRAGAQTADRMVSGRIFDDSTGCPLRAVQVTAVGGAGHVATDAQGRYRMPNPPATTFSLQAMLRGYQPQRADNVTVVDSTERVDFSLVRAAGDSTRGVIYPKRTCRLEPHDSM